MNTVIRKKSSAVADAEYIKRLSAELGLHPRLVELLAMRGVRGEAAVRAFLFPDAAHLNDPFAMKGMREAVSRIRRALDGGEKIVVYGDYDADGICASAILSLCFRSLGADVIVHIPDRMKDGYGLSVESVETILEEHTPDLIVTCDCGISGVREAEHCIDLGTDIIVTDHHEPGEVLPDCVVVDPKQPGDAYPDKYLCGAGVALKLVRALTGNDFYAEFLDIAAVATVADLVPLVGENRLIVQLGLRRIAEGRFNLGLKHIIRYLGLGESVSSTDIAYKIAPRINAAGRMGDAYRAFEILTSSDEERIDELIKEIDADNERRKTLCDEVYSEAEEDLAFEDMVHGRAIMLSNPEWYKGVTGIAAARFTGEYNRPTFIMTDRNENGIYKGTARGVGSVNIFEALSYCSDLLTEFGGHSGAAGFSIAEENIPAFKKRMNEYLSALPDDDFLPHAEYDLEVGADECDASLLAAFARMEPTGNGNERPLLKIETESVRLAPCKNPVHSSVQIGGLQTYAFNFYNKNQFLIGNGRKEIVLELSDGLGGGVSGYIKAVHADALPVNDETAQANFIALAAYGGDKTAKFSVYKDDELARLLPDSVYGTLFVCADGRSYERVMSLGGKFVTCDYMTKAETNNYSGVVVSPNLGDMRLSNYSRIVFVDRPPTDGVVSYINSVSGAEVFVPESISDIYGGVCADREVFAAAYSAISSHRQSACASATVFYKRLLPFLRGMSVKQFAVCYAVFCELGFMRFDGKTLAVDGSVRRQLTESNIYAVISAGR